MLGTASYLDGPPRIFRKTSGSHTGKNHHQRANGHFISSGPSAGGGVFNGSKFPEYEADMDIVNVTYFYS